MCDQLPQVLLPWLVAVLEQAPSSELLSCFSHSREKGRNVLALLWTSTFMDLHFCGLALLWTCTFVELPTEGHVVCVLMVLF